MSYKKLSTKKILRIEHVVTFRPGACAGYIKSMLEKVPDKAVIDEVLRSGDIMEFPGDCSIQFIEEKEES